MTTQMAKQEPGERMTLAQVQEITGYSLPEIALVRATVAKDAASLVDLALFLHGAKRLGLEPLEKQIYWIVRDGKGGIQVGIDGFRSLAARTKEYAGSEPAIFRGVIAQEGIGDVPEMATVVVWRIVQGHKCAFTGEARWREFYPGSKQGFMWRKMPYAQLAKCAEAQALRKGFPAEIGGLSVATGEEDSPHVEVTELPREQPERRRYTADDYTRIHGSDDDGTAFADQQPAPAQDAGLVTTKRDPRWHAFTAAAAQAEAERIDVPDIQLPIPAAELADATETLIEMVAARRADVAVVP